MAINLTEHRRQVEAYIAARPAYETYARVMKRLLENACRPAFSGALVQTRAKDVRSFAEKAARKYEKYRDAVNQFNDLCGARVTVQTLQQVQAVRQFIQANFLVLEHDDKSLHLKEDRFGYRDVHFVVQLRADRDLGITAEERAAIGDRRAEIQVRTWVQHAWADTLHDRIYKTPLRLSAETKRMGNLLAAVMEDGDRTFDRLAAQTDSMRANYSSHASRVDVEQEMAVLSAVLASLPSDAGRAEPTLQLARLLASAHGDFPKVVDVLEPLLRGGEVLHVSKRREVLSELGLALCRVHRAAPDGAAFARGRVLLEESLELGDAGGAETVIDLHKSRSLQARSWSRLAWVMSLQDDAREGALAAYRKALELEPANPYYLADLLGFERFVSRADELSASTCIAIKEALATCREHALAGIEMPYACFTGGRLSLLLGDGNGAIGWYARGLCHCRQTTACVPADVLEGELAYVRRLAVHPRPEVEWVRSLLILARAQRGGDKAAVQKLATPGAPKLALPALIIAGGAGSLSAGLSEGSGAMLTAALENFSGTVISGGTTSGVSGAAGAAAKGCAAAGRKKFALVGYLPAHLPIDAPKDGRYDRLVVCGDTFSADQVIRMWADLLASGAAAGDVQVLGIGGGQLSALEYRIGLALGASAGIVMNTGGSAEVILADELWTSLAELLPLPLDTQTVRAFLHRQGPPQLGAEAAVEEMAREFHSRHMARRMRQTPGQIRPWEDLEETYRDANREQARYVISILAAAGFGVRPVPTGAPPRLFKEFTAEELQRMAEFEHGRWNVERLRAGWRPGAARDNERKVHDLIAPWSDKVLEQYRQYDVEAVRMFPEILARAGLEICRMESPPPTVPPE